MSVSPRQNFLNPPPVPEIPTVTRTLPFLAAWNSSATASAGGNTVLDPSMVMVEAAISLNWEESNRGRDEDLRPRQEMSGLGHPWSFLLLMSAHHVRTSIGSPARTIAAVVDRYVSFR